MKVQMAFRLSYSAAQSCLMAKLYLLGILLG
ncbi:hypothetical protein swp_2447 [Shewanella piezotolerans WP3]|uniref:Uncharacterized protein n=1 Tax=Shewanella piezotolerans (strain WP3 / JCM 13877) TaxID=225849 RepID=B8CMD3_SHEPW|nr:hypothetical protein swp_2447 [Shewanella piezotolerans WP3]